MDWLAVGGDFVRCSQWTLRQIPARPNGFHRVDRPGVVLHLSRGPFSATGDWLETTLVAAPRISLALERSAAVGRIVDLRLHLLLSAARSRGTRLVGRRPAPREYSRRFRWRLPLFR